MIASTFRPITLQLLRPIFSSQKTSVADAIRMLQSEEGQPLLTQENQSIYLEPEDADHQ